MKKMMSLSIIASLILLGCSKEPKNSLAPENINNGVKYITVQLIDANTLLPISEEVRVTQDEVNKHLPTPQLVQDLNMITVKGSYNLKNSAYNNTFYAAKNNISTSGQIKTWNRTESMYLIPTSMEMRDNEVTFISVVTQSSIRQYPVNTFVWWRFRDNGNDLVASPDQRTDYFLFIRADNMDFESFNIDEFFDGQLFHWWDMIFDDYFKEPWSYWELGNTGSIQLYKQAEEVKSRNIQGQTVTAADLNIR